MTKNCPIDFVQRWAIYIKKSNYIYGKEKKWGCFTFLGKLKTPKFVIKAFFF
jgi:hypothetical protein